MESPHIADAIASFRSRSGKRDSAVRQVRKDGKRGEKPCCDADIVIKMPSKCERARWRFRDRFVHVLWVRGEGQAAEAVEEALERASVGVRLLGAYDVFAGAGTHERRAEIFHGLDSRLQDVLALMSPPGWDDADEASLVACAKEARALAGEAAKGGAPSAVSASELYVFICWLREPDDTAELDQAMQLLRETADQVHPGVGSLWRLMQAASPHFDQRRYDLAAKVYSEVYRRMPPEPNTVHLLSGLRLARCAWASEMVIGSKWAERAEAWELLEALGPKCQWHPELESDVAYVVRSIQSSVPTYLHIIEPYFVLLRENASTQKLRHEAARVLAFMLEGAGRHEEAARAYARTARVVDSTKLKGLYLKKSAGLMERGASETRSSHEETRKWARDF